VRERENSRYKAGNILLGLFTPGLILSGFHCCFKQQAQSPASQPSHVIKQSQKKRCSLPEVLWQIGDNYNIYFTIEGIIDNPSTETNSMIWELNIHEPSLAAACDYRQAGATDVIQELQAIQRDLPDLQYARDPLNAKIVHVFVTPLVNQAVYPLSKVIGPIQFQGTAAGFIYYLHRHGVNVGFGVGSFDDTRDPQVYGPREANQLAVNVAFQSVAVRDAISSFTADSKERILWMAMITSIDIVPPGAVSVWFGFRRYKNHVITK